MSSWEYHSLVVKDELAVDQKEQFLEILWEYYTRTGRHDLPWRLAEADGTFDPYKILVSELMLQQTQVSRVVPKYLSFLSHFPDVRSLANAELGDVLRSWQGLGYNRRAKYLWQAAREVAARGAFPASLAELVQLPGVGPNTAGAVLAYAANQPVVFVETNIRTVYIHHFFHDGDQVDDRDIRALVEQTLDREQPREFYWALMDYGSWLKTKVRNIHQSKQYAKQSTFQGSRRQLRGRVIRELSSCSLTLAQLQQIIPDDRLRSVLTDLERESMIRRDSTGYSLS